MTPEVADVVNSLFQAGAAAVCWRDVLFIYRDHRVRGVWWPAKVFFVAMGLWNMLYFPSLGQWWSFSAGVLVVSANATWATLAYRYRNN